MLQVPTQGIANWVERWPRWSFVSMGEYGVQEADYMHYMHYVRPLCAFAILQDK